MEKALELFKKFDCDGSGTIRLEDLYNVLHRLGICAGSVDTLLHKVGADAHGNVQYEKLLAWLEDPGLKPLLLHIEGARTPPHVVKRSVATLQAVHTACLFSASAEGQGSDDPAEPLPGLWLGSKHTAEDITWITGWGVGAVVCMVADSMDVAYPEHVRTLRIESDDADYPLIEAHLHEVFPFVNSCLDASPPFPVLLHCIQGLNRSGALVVAAVMLRRRMPLPDAMLLVSRLRADVVNNEYFQAQLACLAHVNGLAGDPGAGTAAFLDEHARRVLAIHRFFSDSPTPPQPVATDARRRTSSAPKRRAVAKPASVRRVSPWPDRRADAKAAGPRITAISFRRGAVAVCPTISEAQMEELETRAGWYRDDGLEGIVGMPAAPLSAWLAADTRAREHLLPGLLRQLPANVVRTLTLQPPS